MLATPGRSIVTFAVVLEVGIAGWYAGHGALWLLVMTAAVTLADTAWGVARRRALCDLAGFEVAATLCAMLALGADPVLSLLVGLACVAWLVRDRRPAVQATGAA
jgi:cytochrome bd-type quinol oxidase subunit 2